MTRKTLEAHSSEENEILIYWLIELLEIIMIIPDSNLKI